MEENEMYKCAICGKSYKHIEDRVDCESKCLKERKKAEEEKKRNEYNTKQSKSAKEIETKLSALNEMVAEHLKQFETLQLHENYPYLKYIFNNMWWF